MARGVGNDDVGVALRGHEAAAGDADPCVGEGTGRTEPVALAACRVETPIDGSRPATRPRPRIVEVAARGRGGPSAASPPRARTRVSATAACVRFCSRDTAA